MIKVPKQPDEKDWKFIKKKDKKGTDTFSVDILTVTAIQCLYAKTSTYSHT